MTNIVIGLIPYIAHSLGFQENWVTNWKAFPQTWQGENQGVMIYIKNWSIVVLLYQEIPMN